MYNDNNTYKFTIFKQYPQLVHGVTTRAYLTMTENRQIHEKNVTNFLSIVGIDRWKLILAKQTHSNHIAIVTNTKKNIFEDTDGFITKKKNIVLGIITADCYPVFFYDPKRLVIGILHAGYKGIIERIVVHMLDVLGDMGCIAEDIIVGVGPGIGQCCYNVAKERIDLFNETLQYPNMFIQKNGEYFLDLQYIILQELESHGIPDKNIESANLCTKDNTDKFYSYRAYDNTGKGQFLSYIGLVYS